MAKKVAGAVAGAAKKAASSGASAASSFKDASRKALDRGVHKAFTGSLGVKPMASTMRDVGVDAVSDIAGAASDFSPIKDAVKNVAKKGRKAGRHGFGGAGKGTPLPDPIGSMVGGFGMSGEDVADSILRFNGRIPRGSQSLNEAGRDFLSNVSNNRYGIIGDSLKGATLGGIAGGTINAVQGEDFWDGAGQGALVGGGLGATRGVARAGFGGPLAYQRAPGSLRRPSTRSLFQGFEKEHNMGENFRKFSEDAAKARANVTRNAGRSNGAAWEGW